MFVDPLEGTGGAYYVTPFFFFFFNVQIMLLIALNLQRTRQILCTYVAQIKYNKTMRSNMNLKKQFTLIYICPHFSTSCCFVFSFFPYLCCCTIILYFN